MSKYKEDFIAETINFYKKHLQLIRDFKLSINDKDLPHQNIIPFCTYSPWIDDSEFIDAYESIKEYTLVDVYRCYELWNYVKKNSKFHGDIIEVGVWRGGTGCLLAKASQLYSSGIVYLADTFTGVVKASDKDPIYKGGEHSDATIENVNELIGKLNLDNVQILKGIFPEEINFDKIHVNPGISLCHIDVDTYQSGKDIFNYVWKFIVKGGAVIFDDYGIWGCEGITKLCNEIDVPNGCFIYNLNGHAIFIKV